MNLNKVSKLFPSGTVIVAYKGKSLGGTSFIPKWENESQILEFEAVNPQDLIESNCLDSQYNFDGSPGELTFISLDSRDRLAYYLPMAELKNKKRIKKNNSINWKFKIL